jgi:hypothetical protein
MRSALLVLAKHWQARDAAERVLEQADSKGSSLRSGGSPADGGAVGPIIASTILAA